MAKVHGIILPAEGITLDMTQRHAVRLPAWQVGGWFQLRITSTRGTLDVRSVVLKASAHTFGKLRSLH